MAILRLPSPPSSPDLPKDIMNYRYYYEDCPPGSEMTLAPRTVTAEEIVGFARAVRVGPYIAIGGTAPVDANGKTVGVGDAEKQAERCFEIVDDALKRAGSGWADVVRTRIILIDIDDWKKVIDVRARYCREAKPVDTIMQINRFVNPEWLVEIEVDAVVAGE